MPRLRESQQDSPSLPPRGRHKLPREITPEISPLGASWAKGDACATRRLLRVRAKKGANPSRRRNSPFGRICDY